MNFYQYLGKNIKVTFNDGFVIEGYCNGFTGKVDTENELHDELTIKTDRHRYFGFNESEVKSIEMLKNN